MQGASIGTFAGAATLAPAFAEPCARCLPIVEPADASCEEDTAANAASWAAACMAHQDAAVEEGDRGACSRAAEPAMRVGFGLLRHAGMRVSNALS